MCRTLHTHLTDEGGHGQHRVEGLQHAVGDVRGGHDGEGETDLIRILLVELVEDEAPKPGSSEWL